MGYSFSYYPSGLIFLTLGFPIACIDLLTARYDGLNVIITNVLSVLRIKSLTLTGTDGVRPRNLPLMPYVLSQNMEIKPFALLRLLKILGYFNEH